MLDSDLADSVDPRTSGGASPTFRVAARRGRARTLLSDHVQWISLATAIVLWEIVGRLELFSFLPPFSAVVAAWLELVGEGKLSVFIVSLQALAWGFSISLVMALLVALVTSSSETARYVLDPYINAMMSLPTVVLVPVLSLLFGLGFMTRVVVIFLYAFFVILVNTQAGLRVVDPAHVEMARSFGMSRSELFRKVTLPAALPLVLTGIRLGLSRGLRGMVNAEVIISVTGIGALLILYGRRFNMPSLYAIVISVILLSVLATTAISVLERRFLRWQR